MKKEYVIIIVIAALALVWYFFFRKDASNLAAANVVTPGTSAAGLPVASGPITPNVNATATGPSQGLQMALDVMPNAPAAFVPDANAAINSSQYDAIILNWMNGLGAANKLQALTIEPSMSQTEKAALADIISNVWTNHRAQTVADTNFWNAWRVKYHVLDGTYNPFENTNDTEQRAYTGVNNFKMKGAPVDAYGG